MVFLAKNFPPNDPAFAWDGKRDGEALDPAVFAYRLNARFKDGQFEIRIGDFTLVR